MKKAICSIVLGLLLIVGITCTNTREANAAISLEELDYNLNGITDDNDVAILSSNCSISNGDVNWDAKYDLNQDNQINIFDVIIMSKEVYNADITSKFTDVNFKNAVYSLIGKTSSEPILYSDVKSIVEVQIGIGDISNLSGIEYFTALTTLDCSSNKLTSLDVSKNTSLIDLRCSNNQLTSLDVSNNTKLLFLNCTSNQLTTLDVSNNTKLIILYCESNLLTDLDVSKSTKLFLLSCYGNQLTTIDLSNNTELGWLFCDNNKLTTLDVSKNIQLTGLFCNNNQLTTLYSTKDTWADSSYKPQYTDGSCTATTTSLIITIKN